MDIKIDGIPREVLEQALAQAKEARMHILREMLSVIDKPRETLSDYAPKLESVVIPVDKIGAIIGPGGRIIKRIQEEYGVNVEVDEVGRVSIASIDAEGVARAKEVIEGIVSEPELGKVFPGRVTSVKDFGCFVEFLPGQEGLVHISELAEGYIDRVEDVVEMGQEVQVRVVGFDDSGKIKLSIRAVADEDWKPGPPRRSGGKPSGRGPRGDRRGGGGRGRDRGDRDRKPRRRD
jgi:polyribonucleotide nucleotidyltransferase